MSGFTQTTFRAVQLGAQMIAPLALAWGITEVAARSMPVRFVARLGLSALTVVALVILGTDPLSSQPFTRTWPKPSSIERLSASESSETVYSGRFEP